MIFTRCLCWCPQSQLRTSLVLWPSLLRRGKSMIARARWQHWRSIPAKKQTTDLFDKKPHRWFTASVSASARCLLYPDSAWSFYHHWKTIIGVEANCKRANQSHHATRAEATNHEPCCCGMDCCVDCNVFGEVIRCDVPGGMNISEVDLWKEEIGRLRLKERRKAALWDRRKVVPALHLGTGGKVKRTMHFLCVIGGHGG